MITTKNVLKSWHEYLDRSPEWDRLNMLQWWAENKPELWRQFIKEPGRYADLIEKVSQRRSGTHAEPKNGLRGGN